MTDETRNDRTPATVSRGTAGRAALIATFYGPRIEPKFREGPVWELYDQLRQRFRGEWRDLPDCTWWKSEPTHAIGRRFNLPGRAAMDTSTVQLALNADGDAALDDDAALDWQKLYGQLVAALNIRKLEGIWGHTLIYQAVLRGNIDPDRALNRLLPSIRQLGSDNGLKVLEKAEVPGGWMWLVDIPVSIPNQGDPNQGDKEDRSAAGTVYCALSRPEGEEALLNMFYGRGAELLTLDLIAHKGYYQMRQYRDEKAELEHRHLVSLGKLRELTDRLREDLQPKRQDEQQTNKKVTDKRLEEPIGTYYQLLTVVSSLKELHFGVLRQLENYDRQRKRLDRNDIIEYHRDQLDTAVRELSLMIEPLEYELEMVDKAIAAAQLQIANNREEVQHTRHQEAMGFLTDVERLLAAVTALLAIATITLVVIEVIHLVHKKEVTEAIIVSGSSIAFTLLAIFVIREARYRRGR